MFGNTGKACERFFSELNKPFDITQHIFSHSDYDTQVSAAWSDSILAVCLGVDNTIHFDKNDIIAMAKSAKLTAEDLK